MKNILNILSGLTLGASFACLMRDEVPASILFAIISLGLSHMLMLRNCDCVCDDDTEGA